MKNGDKVKWVYLKDNPLGIDGLLSQVIQTHQKSKNLFQPILTTIKSSKENSNTNYKISLM